MAFSVWFMSLLTFAAHSPWDNVKTPPDLMTEESVVIMGCVLFVRITAGSDGNAFKICFAAFSVPFFRVSELPSSCSVFWVSLIESLCIWDPQTVSLYQERWCNLLLSPKGPGALVYLFFISCVLWLTARGMIQEQRKRMKLKYTDINIKITT